MTVKRYKKDPRSKAEKEADAEVLHKYEKGEILRSTDSVEEAAVEYVRSRSQERRDLAARIGLDVAVLRRTLGVSQKTVARAIGTQKSNISRVESGRYGGLTLERLLAILEAIAAASGSTDLSSSWTGPLRRKGGKPRKDDVLDRFKTVSDCLEVSES
jgi:transcriptional regulator with XRE-family HTH domain